MSQPIKVKVAGEEYTVSSVNPFAFFPLLDVVKSDPEPEDKKSKAYRKWEKRFERWFSKPMNHYTAAYVVRTILPNLPESICRYKVFLHKKDGAERYRFDAHLGISALDFNNLIESITPLMNAQSEEIRATVEKDVPKLNGDGTVTVSIAGVEYKISGVDDFALAPLRDLLVDAPKERQGKDYDAWEQRFYTWFSSPINHYDAAYVIRSLVPELPESVCKYKLYLERGDDDDCYEIDGHFGIPVIDFMRLLQVVPLFTETEAPATAPSVSALDAKRSALQAELAALETASEA
jgi:hypothetical protein